MTEPRRHDELDTAAAWVLGALPDDEARAFADHLATCAACQAEVAQLQPVADVLPLAAPAEAPGDELRARIMAVVEREAKLLAATGPAADAAPPAPAQRRGLLARLFGRPWLTAAAAGTALAVGVAIGIVAAGGVGGGDVVSHPVTGVAEASSARGALVQRGDRGELELRGLPAPPPGHVYQAWVMRGGKPEPDAVFTVDRQGASDVPLRGDLDGAQAVAISVEPEGGSDAPTTTPTVTAALS